ncbi:MAG: tetratricopeptide repeat protein [Ignavibacteriaceae bacterium]|nr:tetratricopeptide repeat protein [Ignavibacteriaceae bacterium]
MFQIYQQLLDEKAKKLASEGQSRSFFIRVAKVLTDEGDYESALSVIKENLKIYKDYPSAYLLLSMILTAKRDFSGAIFALNRACEQYPNSETYKFYHDIIVENISVHSSESASLPESFVSSETFDIKRELFIREIEKTPEDVIISSHSVPDKHTNDLFDPGSITDVETQNTGEIELKSNVENGFLKLTRDLFRSKLKSNFNTKPENEDNQAKLNPEESVKILVDSGDYDAAIKIYLTLKIENPTKSDYYDTLIKDLILKKNQIEKSDKEL